VAIFFSETERLRLARLVSLADQGGDGLLSGQKLSGSQTHVRPRPYGVARKGGV